MAVLPDVSKIRAFWQRYIQQCCCLSQISASTSANIASIWIKETFLVRAPKNAFHEAQRQFCSVTNLILILDRRSTMRIFQIMIFKIFAFHYKFQKHYSANWDNILFLAKLLFVWICIPASCKSFVFHACYAVIKRTYFGLRRRR